MNKVYKFQTDKRRLNYMQAWIKTYNDGTEILQSYNTDVVRKNPDGTYTRLWHSWSPSTSKQVRAYCGRSFRDIPFEDGTIEDRSVEYKRKGYDLLGHKNELTPVRCKIEAKKYADAIKIGSSIYNDYSTIYDKDLKEIYKTNKRMCELVDIMSMCAKRKLKGNKSINSLIKLKNFDFVEMWNSGLSELYPELVL